MSGPSGHPGPQGAGGSPHVDFSTKALCKPPAALLTARHSPALPAWASRSQLPSPPLPLPQAFCPAVLAPSCLAGLLAEAPGSCRRSSRAPRGPQGKVVWGTRLFVPASRGGIIPYCGETGHPCRGHLSPGGWGEDGGASAEVGVGEQGGRSCHHHLGDKKGHSPPILSPPREEQFW